MYSVKRLNNGKKLVRFMSESVNGDEIYINTRKELDNLLRNYPSVAPRVVIGSFVKLDYALSNVVKNIDISNWDVSNVTNMSSMFYNSNFNGDISKWDVSNVKDMGFMFEKSNFNGNISNWDVSNVEDMYGMFADSKFNRDISNWDVSNVEDMSYMFYNSIFNKDISNWDVSSLEDTKEMFTNTPLMNSGKLPNWYV